jgi:amidase
MFQNTLRRLRVQAEETWLQLRSAQYSYERLPTEPESQDEKRHGRRRPVNLVLTLVVLLVISGVSVGLVFIRSSDSELNYPPLISATIQTLTEGLARKDFTSVDLVKAYTARIAEVNEIFHAVDEVNPDALVIAAELDLERSEGSIRGPLHGIPILIKNNIATNDKMNNTAESYALLGAKVPRDATVAQKLRAAGAILLGKTSMSQWANFRSFNGSNGWSAVGGQGYAPYFPNQDPWGSSSGSGVASA